MGEETATTVGKCARNNQSEATIWLWYELFKMIIGKICDSEMKGT